VRIGDMYEVELGPILNPVTSEPEEIYLDKPTGFTSKRLTLGPLEAYAPENGIQIAKLRSLRIVWRILSLRLRGRSRRLIFFMEVSTNCAVTREVAEQAVLLLPIAQSSARARLPPAYFSLPPLTRSTPRAACRAA